MEPGVRFVCNQLYEYLFSDRVKPVMKFLTDDQFRDPDLDLSGVEGILAQPFLVQKPLLDRAPDVKWIQGTGAGYDAADVEEIRRRGLILTNSRGVMSISIAEDVLCKMLFFSRRVRQVEQDKKDQPLELLRHGSVDVHLLHRSLRQEAGHSGLRLSGP